MSHVVPGASEFTVRKTVLLEAVAVMEFVGTVDEEIVNPTRNETSKSARVTW